MVRNKEASCAVWAWFWAGSSRAWVLGRTWWSCSDFSSCQLCHQAYSSPPAGVTVQIRWLESTVGEMLKAVPLHSELPFAQWYLENWPETLWKSSHVVVASSGESEDQVKSMLPQWEKGNRGKEVHNSFYLQWEREVSASHAQTLPLGKSAMGFHSEWILHLW